MIDPSQHAQLFGEYAIRGDAERDLSDDFMRDLGRALGTFLSRRGKHRVALGRDCRLSSPRLHAALTDGLLESGLRLHDIGVAPTPLLYFAVCHSELDAGVEITGSHGPPDDNGLKVMCGRQLLSGAELRELQQLLLAGDFDRPGAGSVEQLDPGPAYCGYVRGNFRLGRSDLRFAVDAGNGAGGPLALSAMQALGLRPRAQHCEMDGSFPHRAPDCADPENLGALIDTVRGEGLELGIAYDGDADRLAVVDERGDVLWGDRLMILLSRPLLARHPGAAVVGEVKCSQTLYEDIARHGGRPVIWKTGHSLIARKVQEEGALLGGEMSGHLFFADRYYGYDDAIYASLRVLELMSHGERPLSELLADLPAICATPEIRVACPDEAKAEVVAKVLEHFRPAHEVLDLDGARITFDGGWGLVRASNTEPALVMRFEAQSPERLERIQQTVEAVVSQAL